MSVHLLVVRADMEGMAREFLPPGYCATTCAAGRAYFIYRVKGSAEPPEAPFHDIDRGFISMTKVFTTVDEAKRWADADIARRLESN